MSDARQAAIERAIRAKAQALLSREIGVREFLAAVANATMGGTEIATPRESAAAKRQSRREAMLSELDRYVQSGHGRNAPMKVARKFAGDPHDDIEVASLARKLRRWRCQDFRTVSVSPPTNQA